MALLLLNGIATLDLCEDKGAREPKASADEMRLMLRTGVSKGQPLDSDPTNVCRFDNNPVEAKLAGFDTAYPNALWLVLLPKLSEH